MDKTIESKFFEAFKWGGVVDRCIDWMRYTYHLPPMKPRASSNKDEQPKDEAEKEAKEKWDRYYRETLPKEILAATEAFDDSVIKYMDSPLMDEIEANLNECKNDAQRERYLFSLLKPFGESPSGCGIAGIYNPIAQINRLYKNISDCENDKAIWQAVPENDPLKKESGKQIEACNSEIERYRQQIDWIKEVNHQFCDLTGKVEDGAKWMQKGTVEWCLSAFVEVKGWFANRLDALLLTYGIDFMRLQNESGIYLKRHRLIVDVDGYIGSKELAQKYIDALPKEPQPEQAAPEPQQELKDLLPDKLKGNEAVAIFQKAIDANLISKTTNSLIWNDTKQLLAYFAEKMSVKFALTIRQDKDGNKTISWKTFETLFNENGLKGAKQNWMRLYTRFEPTGFEKVDALM